MRIRFINELIYRDHMRIHDPWTIGIIPILPKHFIKNIAEGESYICSLIGYKRAIHHWDYRLGHDPSVSMEPLDFSTPIYRIWRLSLFFLWFGVRIDLFEKPQFAVYRGEDGSVYPSIK